MSSSTVEEKHDVVDRLQKVVVPGGQGRWQTVACGSAGKTNFTRIDDDVVCDGVVRSAGQHSFLPLPLRDSNEPEMEARQRAATALRQGWLAAKSPKSYWLRRHSDSLLVAVVSDDAQPNIHHRNGVRSHTDNLVGLDSRSSVSSDLRLEDDEGQPDRDPDNHNPDNRWRPVWATTVDYDDVFDDTEEPQLSSLKSSSSVANALSKSSSSVASVHVSSSPSADVVETWMPSADEITMRLEQLHPADVVRSSRSQRSSSSATLDDDQCETGLPRIVEEREEVDVTSYFSRHEGHDRHHIGNRLLSSARLETVVPTWSDLYEGTIMGQSQGLFSTPTSSTSMSGTTCLEMIAFNERRHHSVRSDSPPDEDLITTTSAMRRSRSIDQSNSAYKTSRTQLLTTTSSTSEQSESSAPVVDSSMSSTTSKLHRCLVCRRSFARSDMLERHARLHTGVRPYSCRLCSQVFSRSDHLTTHLRTHTGEKPYQCPRCTYSASRRDMVTRHLRVHVHEAGSGLGCDNSTLSMSAAQLSPLNVGCASAIGVRRRYTRTKKKERQQQTKFASYRSPSPPMALDPKPISAAAAYPQSTMRRHPLWMSSRDCTDSVIKAAVDSWARSSMKFSGSLASPSPIRPSMSFQHDGDEATGSGLPHLLGRGSTGSIDSYNSPGCCSIAGGSDVFEFGAAAEDSPDVFRSPTVAARHTVKFLWPLVAPSTTSPRGCSNSPQYLFNSGI